MKPLLSFFEHPDKLAIPFIVKFTTDPAPVSFAHSPRSLFWITGSCILICSLAMEKACCLQLILYQKQPDTQMLFHARKWT